MRVTGNSMGEGVGLKSHSVLRNYEAKMEFLD